MSSRRGRSSLSQQLRSASRRVSTWPSAVSELYKEADVGASHLQDRVVQGSRQPSIKVRFDSLPQLLVKCLLICSAWREVRKRNARRDVPDVVSMWLDVAKDRFRSVTDGWLILRSAANSALAFLGSAKVAYPSDLDVREAGRGGCEKELRGRQVAHAMSYWYVILHPGRLERQRKPCSQSPQGGGASVLGSRHTTAHKVVQFRERSDGRE